MTALALARPQDVALPKASPAPSAAAPSAAPSAAAAPGAATAEDEVRDLFFRARKGDEAAVEALCRVMRPRLYRVAFSVVKDRDEADDLAQDGLIRALEKRALFLGKGSVSGWMARVTLNLARNRRRDRARRRELLDQAPVQDLDLSRADATRAADDVIADKHLQARLGAALDELPKRQREVLSLRLLGELPFADIAATLGISEANARVAASEGHKRLRQKLHDLARPAPSGGKP